MDAASDPTLTEIITQLFSFGGIGILAFFLWIENRKKDAKILSWEERYITLQEKFRQDWRYFSLSIGAPPMNWEEDTQQRTRRIQPQRTGASQFVDFESPSGGD